MHTEIPAGLSSYPTQQGKLYRFAGILRGSNATEFMNALTSSGMALQALSADAWPADENLPPLSDGEMYVRGEGKWTSPSPMPTGFQLTNGSGSIFQVWEFTPSALEKASVTVPGPASASGSYGLGVGLVVLGVLAAGALLISQRKENPQRYVRTVHYRGVPIHIHYDDVKDDYSVDFVVAGQHVRTSAGHFEETAVDLSKKKIDRVLGQLQLRSAKVYPSPWS